LQYFARKIVMKDVSFLKRPIYLRICLARGHA